MSPKPHILPIIIAAQFFCTSMWFAGNAVLNDSIDIFDVAKSDVGHLTTAVQIGFIIGTLLFAILSLADRFHPSKLFLASALAGAVFNSVCIWIAPSFEMILLWRFMTGFCLAGIYPVGMKIAADYYEKGLGKSLGYLVGALVFGTSLPFLFKGLELDLGWKSTLIFTSILSALGGLLMLFFIPAGPHRKKTANTKLSGAFTVFKNRKFRKAAFAYFGHMWELYTFWTFLPLLLIQFSKTCSVELPIHILTFIIIAIGGFGCIIGGTLSIKKGPARVALVALCLSTICCLTAYFVLISQSLLLFIILMSFWGVAVIMDSPMLSTLVATNAPADNRGTALTIVNCLGFAITIASIQVIGSLIESIGIQYVFFVLALGPLLGLTQMFSLRPKT